MLIKLIEVRPLLLGKPLGVQMLNDMKKDIATLLAEKDPLVRNNLALSLCETSSKEVYDALCSIIRKDIQTNTIGTLVYCLNSFPYEWSFGLAVDIVCSSNFESVHVAENLLNEIDYVDGDEAEMSYKKLVDRLNQQIEDWRQKIIFQLLKMYE